MQDAEQVDEGPEAANFESLGGGVPLTGLRIVEKSVLLQSIAEGGHLFPWEGASAENDPQESEKDSTPKNKRKRAPAKSPYFSPTKINSKDYLPHETGSPVLPRTPTNHGSLESNATPPHTPKQNPAHSSTQLRPRPSPRGCLSCIPFPPLDSPTFGLIQERLAHDPFRLLIAVTFLIRTHGKHAIPVFFELMTRYPTPESLIEAEKTNIVAIIRHLGLQNQRAATYQTYAQIWLNNPPVRGKRYPVKDYPTKGSGRSIPKDEEFISDEDEREAWEIGHMTQGPYALDSWRIFCRDVCRGLAKSWNGEGCTEEGFQPEWMRVLPGDKELRAYLRWMWLKEGFAWDPLTGDKGVASPELLRAAMEGRIAWDDEGGMTILGPKVDQQMTAQSP